MILVIFVTTLADSVLGMQYAHADHFSIWDIPTSPYIALHQVAPRIMWWQSDMIMIGTTLVTVLVYGYLVGHSNLPERYRLYPINGGKNLVIDSKG